LLFPDIFNVSWLTIFFRNIPKSCYAKKFMLDAGDVKRSLQSFRAAAIMVTPYERIFAARDPDDNKVLECATEADAQYIVTGNIRDFPPVFHGVAVVLPRRFLDILTAQP